MAEQALGRERHGGGGDRELSSLLHCMFVNKWTYQWFHYVTLETAVSYHKVDIQLLQ